MKLRFSPGWTHEQRLAEVLIRSKDYMPATVAHQVDALLTPEALGIAALTLSLWAGSHFFGVGEVVDVGLLLVGAFFVGWSITDVAKSLLEFGDKTFNARRDEDLDLAAKAFASAFVNGGLTVVMALLMRRSATKLQVFRGPNVSEVMRLRRPGLVSVDADPQAGRFWRQPTVTGDPTMKAGRGRTSDFGDLTYSTAGTATEQQLVKIHEMVHSFLSPRLGVLRRFRVRLAMSAYRRSAFLRYLEEALAESVAQLMVFGALGLLRSLKFPVATGYVSLQQLATEGASIGSIVVGTQRFSVQFIPSAPPYVCTPTD